jgi:hypothetical protein
MPPAESWICAKSKSDSHFAIQAPVFAPFSIEHEKPSVGSSPDECGDSDVRAPVWKLDAARRHERPWNGVKLGRHPSSDIPAHFVWKPASRRLVEGRFD